MAKRAATRADAVRQAVDEAFQSAAGQVGQAAAVQRGRAQELVDELTGGVARLRDALDDLRPPSGDDLRDLRAEVRRLSERVARLESAQAAAAQARPPARGGRGKASAPRPPAPKRAPARGGAQRKGAPKGTGRGRPSGG